MPGKSPNKVLVFNAGSASLKFALIASDVPQPGLVKGTKLLSGVVEPMGKDAAFNLLENGKKSGQECVDAKDHGEAAQRVLERLDGGLAAEHGIANMQDIDIVGHRVVHGADLYDQPALIDDEVIKAIQELEELAPLHNVGALGAIRASRQAIGDRTPQVAVFDTAFHRTIPDRAKYYAIPWELTERHRIQRYGFHGLSHNYLMLRYAELTKTPVEQTNIITLHLEGGSSAAAIVGGKSIDTSMGFTPLEGLIMGTRSGDIDPALVTFLARKEKIDAAAVEELLNKKSGLLGVSGVSQDTRELIKQKADKRVALAMEMFAYRVRKYIGAYLAAAGKTDAIVFGGGIGENTAEVRHAICEGLDWFGLNFDEEQNRTTIDCEGRITKEDSRLHAFVIPTEEGLMIAHEALLAQNNNFKAN